MGNAWGPGEAPIKNPGPIQLSQKQFQKKLTLSKGHKVVVSDVKGDTIHLR